MARARNGQPAGRLLHVTGIAEIGPASGTLVQGTLASARLHELPHEVLPAPELMRRFPAFRLPRHYVAVLQPDGGFLEAEPSITAHLALASAAGAEIRSGETMRAIEPGTGFVRVITDRGTVEGGAAIVTVGAWTKSLLPKFGATLRVTREVMGWFAVADNDLSSAGQLPGVHYRKPAWHALRHPGAARRERAARQSRSPSITTATKTVDPDAHDRTVSADDEALIRCAIADHLPMANGELIAATTCLYTMTPDGHFLIDHLPGASNVIVASPCSGHGFKFAPVIGEVLADLATTGTTRHDISRFSLRRFG